MNWEKKLIIKKGLKHWFVDLPLNQSIAESGSVGSFRPDTSHPAIRHDAVEGVLEPKGSPCGEASGWFRMSSSCWFFACFQSLSSTVQTCSKDGNVRCNWSACSYHSGCRNISFSGRRPIFNRFAISFQVILKLLKKNPRREIRSDFIIQQPFEADFAIEIGWSDLVWQLHLRAANFLLDLDGKWHDNDFSEGWSCQRLSTGHILGLFAWPFPPSACGIAAMCRRDAVSILLPLVLLLGDQGHWLRWVQGDFFPPIKTTMEKKQTI